MQGQYFRIILQLFVGRCHRTRQTHLTEGGMVVLCVFVIIVGGDSRRDCIANPHLSP